MAKQFITIFLPAKHSHSEGESRASTEDRFVPWKIAVSGPGAMRHWRKGGSRDAKRHTGDMLCTSCSGANMVKADMVNAASTEEETLKLSGFSGQLHSQRVHFLRVTNVLNNLKSLSPIEHRVPSIIPLVSFGCQPCIVCLQVFSTGNLKR